MNQIKYCPNCGAHVGERAVFCGNCGYKIPVEAVPAEKREENRRKNKMPKEAMKAAAVVLALALAAGGIAKLKVAGYLGGLSEEQEIPNLYYVKNGTAYGTRLEDRDGEPMEFGTDRKMGELFSNMIGYRLLGKDYEIDNTFFRTDLMSQDGNYQFIIEDIEEKDWSEVYSLYYSKNGEKPVEIDSGIYMHRLAADHCVVYKKNGNLYISDLEKIKKLGTDIRDFYLNEKKDTILWEEIDPERGENHFYVQELKEGSRKVKIGANCSIVDFTKDFSRILMSNFTTSEEEGCFIIENLKNVRYISNKARCRWVDFEKEKFIFYDSDYDTGITEFTVVEKNNEDSFRIKTGSSPAIYYDEEEDRIYSSSKECGLIQISCSQDTMHAVKEIYKGTEMAWLVETIFNPEKQEADIYYIVRNKDGGADQLFCGRELLLSGDNICIDTEFNSKECMWGTMEDGQDRQLFKLTGGRAKFISNDVDPTYLQTLPGGCALFIESYDNEAKFGDLIYYDGKESHLIETDVEEFLYWEE